MHILVLGLNHKTSPLNIREKFYIPEEKMDFLISELKKEGLKEIVILSTCNRTEFYVFSENPGRDLEVLKDSLVGLLKVEEGWIKEYMYVLLDEDGFRHLLMVASGLDSMVVGEPQILGQVKEAYRIATFNNSTGFLSNKIFHKAFQVAKRVRTETKVGYNPLSISSMAVEMAKRIFGNLSQKKVMAVGAGEMAKIALKNLKKEGIEKVYVVNRTFANAKKLAEEIVGEARPFSDIERLLLEVDLVLTSTGAEDFVIKKDDVVKAMRQRKFKPLFIIDIAVPRDVEPSANDIENVYLYNIDDLKELSHKHLIDRLKEAEKAKEIVETEVKKLPALLRQIDTKPLIMHMIDHAERIRKAELKKMLSKMKNIDDSTYRSLDQLTRSLVNKIIHPHIELVKKEGTYEVVEIMKKLFQFEDFNERENKSRDEG
jgi:glutamyl-tRNA reductase